MYIITGSVKVQTRERDMVRNAEKTRKKSGKIGIFVVDIELALWYISRTSLSGFFFCVPFFAPPLGGRLIRECGKLMEVPIENESQDYVSVHRVQTSQLRHNEEQKEQP